VKSTLEAANIVMRTLTEAGFQAFLVGGCVRDRVMGETPKDFDVTTDATPEQVMALFDYTIPVGISFGVVRILVKADPTDSIVDASEIEVATFRADGEYTDGRRPDTVSFSSTVQDDVSRRDFTINGLVMNAAGEVKDFVGGLEDVQNQQIRCIGDPAKRFNEDSLRMLRAVRFAARFDFKIEANTLAAITERADTLSRVSQERITDELLKMFGGPRPGMALRLLAETTLLFQVFPELRFVGAEDAVSRFNRLLRKVDPLDFEFENPLVVLALVLLRVERSKRQAVIERLKLSNEQAETVTLALKPRI
jgi:poly(A) polymerase